MGGIYLFHGEDQLLEMAEQEYDSEDLLQTLLAKYPNLLAGDQIDPAAPRRWLLVKREAPVPSEEGGSGRWSIDHLFLDQDAIPTIVEVKRSTDTRIRREVVGQMLEYAANAVAHWPIDKVRSYFEDECRARGVDPNEEITSFLGSEEDSEEFWQEAKTNLQAGHIRLVFVADEIPTELGRIVEFLNSQMDPAQVLAIEVKQHVNQGLKVFVVRLIGQTVEAQRRKSTAAGSQRRWDTTSVMEELENRHGVPSAQIAAKILDWARKNMPEIRAGKGDTDGNLIPTLNHKGTNYWLTTVSTNGKFALCFRDLMDRRPPFTDKPKRLELLHRMNQIAGFKLPEDAVDKYPTRPLLVLEDEAVLAQFLRTLDWFVDEVKKS